MELWEEDLYELLGVDSEATGDEIKKAYKKKAVELHPDRFPDDEAKRQEATTLFGRITNAYNVLKDEEERAEYDFARRMGFGSAGAPAGPGAKPAGGAKPAAASKPASGAAQAEDAGVSDAKKSQAQNQFDQGKVYHKGKNWQKAIACYKEAVRMDPTVADYHAHLGLAYLQQGLKTPANNAFAAAFKLDKGHKILKEHYEPAQGGGPAGKKGKDAPKQGLLAQLMAMFGGGGDKKNAKGKKGAGKKGAPKKAGSKR